MTAEQIIKEIKALSQQEREKLFRYLRDLKEDMIPADFIEALEDFAQERFVSMDTALNVAP